MNDIYNNFLEFLKWVKAQKITFNDNNILIIKTELIDSAHQYIIGELNDEIQDIILCHLRSCDYNTMLHNDGSEPDLTEDLYFFIKNKTRLYISI